MNNRTFSLDDLPDLLGGGEPSGAEEPRRVFNGRGNKYPGLEFVNVDSFPPLFLVSVYKKTAETDIEKLTNLLKELYPESPLLIQDRGFRPVKTLFASKDLPNELVVREQGLEYLIHPGRGQNIGFFPDMREGRRLVRDLVEKRPGTCRVLNLFAYTCAFSVAALAAGAVKSVNMDMNRNSLEIGKKNHRLNSSRIPGGYRNQALFLPHDIFKSWGRLKKEGPYEIIIADPPPSQKGSFLLEKDYPRLLKRLPEMLVPGGRLLLTCNTGELDWIEFETLVKENFDGFFVFTRVDPPEDYAVKEAGRGLKILLAKTEDG